MEDGISSCQKHLEIVKQAESKAKEIDQLSSEITAADDGDMEMVETKTQVLVVLVSTSVKYYIFFIIVRSVKIPNAIAIDWFKHRCVGKLCFFYP